MNIHPVTTAHASAASRTRERVQSVSVVFDVWNVLIGASDGFGLTRRDLSEFTFDPVRLADLIAADRRTASRVERIGLVFGTHSLDQNRAACQAQRAAMHSWRRDPRVTVVDPGMERIGPGRRHDRTPASPDGVTVTSIGCHTESRGDAEIQRLLTEWCEDRRTDVAVLVSADADHRSVAHDLWRRRRTHLELARWSWEPSQLFWKGAWVHHLDQQHLRAVTRNSYRGRAA